VVAVSLALAAPAEAQFARASLRGEATDPDGAALPGVTVPGGAFLARQGSVGTKTNQPGGAPDPPWPPQPGRHDHLRRGGQEEGN